MTDLEPLIREDDHVRGPEDGPVVLTHFGDFECPQSRLVYQIVERMRQRAPRQIRYVYRHFPLNKVHPHAERAAVAAEAAGAQGKFWEMHDLLFSNQDSLEDEDLTRYAEALELDVEQFTAGLEDDALGARVRADRRSALKLGLDTTANLFINGTRYRGEIGFEAVTHALEQSTGIQPGYDETSARGTSSTKEVRRQQDQPTHARDTTLSVVCARFLGVNAQILESVLTLALEIAREGREGRKIGTIFTVGDAEAVMRHSRPLIMDPLLGHPEEARHVNIPDMRETVKELAQLDGGFVITGEGVVLSAARYFDAASHGLDLPLGLGSRHMAGASISLRTAAVAVVVSESSMVRIFRSGKMATEIVPELWMLRRYGLKLLDEANAASRPADRVTVIERN